MPVQLSLKGRDVLVVGGGPVATRRVLRLLEYGAQVHLVAPEVCRKLSALLENYQGTVPSYSFQSPTTQSPSVQNTSLQSASVYWHQRVFQEADIEGKWLIFAHTDSVKVNQEIFELSQRQQKFCLVGATSHISSLWMLAHRSLGEGITLAVSAGGRPKLAQKILEKISTKADTNLDINVDIKDGECREGVGGK